MNGVIDILGYREWARELWSMVANRSGGKGIHWHDHLDLTCRGASSVYPIAGTPTFAVGWSEMIPESFYTSRPVFVLHPSPLPKYRGGSPIQNQIIAGETHSAVTIFKLDPAYPEVDSGPIAWSMPYCLEGDLKDILQQIAMIGSLGVAAIIGEAERVGWDNLPLLPQPEGGGWQSQRRAPAQSKITMQMLATWPALRLHNFVRALQDPYPNAFIETAEGRLYITKTHLENKS